MNELNLLKESCKTEKEKAEAENAEKNETTATTIEAPEENNDSDLDSLERMGGIKFS